MCSGLKHSCNMLINIQAVPMGFHLSTQMQHWSPNMVLILSDQMRVFEAYFCSPCSLLY
jgi:hypothetical protein